MKPESKIEKIYTLSPMQEGMLFHYLLDRKSKIYIDRYIFDVRGKIDNELFAESLHILVERYDVLRTIFHYEEVQEPLQIVLKKRKFKIEFKDISTLSKDEQARELEELEKKELDLGFDLTRDHLMRILLIYLGKELYRLIWSFHHILMDGWCLGIIFKDLLQIYARLKKGAAVELEPVPPYSQYIKWLGRQNIKKGLDYWQKYLTGYEASIQITGEASQTSKETREYILNSFSCNLDISLSQMIVNTAAAGQVTVNSICQAAWGILLQKYNNSDDVVFGAVVSGRPSDIPGIEKMVGLFVNTIPVRIRTSPIESFGQLLAKLHLNSISSKKYEYLSLGKIQSLSWIKNQLINHIIVFDNYPVHQIVDQAVATQELEFNIDHLVEFREQTNFDLTITIWMGEQLYFRFDFNALIYQPEFIEQIANRFMSILTQVTANPGIKIHQIEIITQEEKKWLLDECNCTGQPYPKHKTMAELFAGQVKKRPDNIAMMGFPGIKNKIYMTYITSVSYNHLHEKSDQLSHILIEKGVKPDTIVGIMMERSIETIIGIFAIIKAGGAYLPIDPQYPRERVDYMLKDSNAGILLTSPELKVQIEVEIKESLDLPRHFINIEVSKSSESFPSAITSINQISSTNLAYVIYTSGSTGWPKGTAIQHHSLVNRLHWMQNQYPLDERDIILHKTPFTFDVSIWEIFWWSIVGAAVYLLVPRGEKDPIMIADTVIRAHITVMHFVPSMFDAFLNYLEENKKNNSFSCLNQVFCSGEVLSASQVNRFNSRLAKDHSIGLANLYGPTEATIDVSYYNCPVDENREIIPIGKPIDNIQLYILDKYWHLQSVGVTGELYIAGIGLARGYLNKPELTCDKFINGREGHEFNKLAGIRMAFNQKRLQGSITTLKGSFLEKHSPDHRRHPSARVPSKRTYKTGDLARWQPDGNIEFLGRLDFQVKIKGFRIETGEIENRLREHQNIKQAVVIDQPGKNNDRYLCAYFVSCRQEADGDFSVSVLREYLSKKLPYFMIPQYFFKIETIPLTPSGKVNRKALYLQGTPLTSGAEHAEPASELEKIVARAWQEVLQVDKVGIYDHFFHIGGDSLKIIRLTQRLNRLLDTNIPVVEVFEHLTIESFVQYLQGSQKLAGTTDALGTDSRENHGEIAVQARKTSARRRAKRAGSDKHA